MFASPPDGIRLAELAEAEAVANLWLDSRRAAAPAIPDSIHPAEDVHVWFTDVVLPTQNVWVIGPRNQPQAMMVLTAGWIDQLYVAPAHQRQGHGSRLIEFAKSRHSQLSLHTFVTNHGARAFYERHGFTAAGSPTNDNEEGAPALLYRWKGAR